MALLTAVSMCFALGAATTGEFKHLAAAEAGLLAGGALPGLRPCARNWRRSQTGPIRWSSDRCTSPTMLATDGVVCSVCSVDDHSVLDCGAKPIADCWNNRLRAGRKEAARTPA